MLLLIYCFMYLPLFVAVLCWSLFWYALLYVLSSFAINWARKRELVSLLLLLLNVCKCPVAHPHGATGVVFPDHTHLLLQDMGLCKKK